MINPNRSYRSKIDGVVTQIDPLDSYMPYITIRTLDGEREFRGPLRDSQSQVSGTRWAKLRVGDQVGFTCRWSICADRWVIDSFVVRRKPKAGAA